MSEFEIPSHLRHGMPQKVMAKAVQLGIHNDCIVAGPEGVCEDCQKNIFLAFDFYYGPDLSPEELTRMIAGDFLADFEATVYSDGE